MSALWIIITGFSILSTLLVFGLAFWWSRMEKQEHDSFNKLLTAEEKIVEALAQDSERKPAETINAVLSEMPFPLQKYAESLKARTKIEGILDGVITELKRHEEPKTSTP